MNLEFILILLPLFTAAILLLVKSRNVRIGIVIVSLIVILGIVTMLATQYMGMTRVSFEIPHEKVINQVMMVLEALLGGYLILVGIKNKRLMISLLALVQTVLVLWVDLSKRLTTAPEASLYIDKFSIIMAIIVSVVGGLICVYAIGYMRDYQENHKDYQDRRPYFFSMLFVFLSAMFGLVFSDNMVWMLFFWEVTTLISFLLIGYNQTKEARGNAFRALWMNLLGGLAFALAVIYCALVLHNLSLNTLVTLAVSNPQTTIPVMLLCFAGLVKSAQFPFSKWLLGAMVAPTPTSALLHSATMVKAGVFLLIRLAPALGNNSTGTMVTLIGGLTFLSASLIAISQSDSKKVLAYSTIANLGLIVACAGVGNPESLWAGILLLIFHALSKSLMFLSVGAIENNLGSRDIEDMHGLIIKLPELALVTTIGIAGMFLAPFGMLISKWAALKAFVDSGNLVLVMFLVYGSAATLFYWTKWLGKLAAVLHHSERLKSNVKQTEWFSLLSHAFIMVALCLGFPLVSKVLVEPFLKEMYHLTVPTIIQQGNMNIMAIMLCMIVVLPFALRFLAFGRRAKEVTVYMSGINTGDDRTFHDSLGHARRLYLSNWYLSSYFGEKQLLLPAAVLSTAMLIVFMAIVMGGAL